MKVQNLEDAFSLALSDIYSAEERLVKALFDLAKAAAQPKLNQLFIKHLMDTKDSDQSH